MLFTHLYRTNHSFTSMLDQIRPFLWSKLFRFRLSLELLLCPFSMPTLYRYGSDVVLVSFCGISGCEILILSRILPTFVRHIVAVDAKAVWLLSSSRSKRILILASFNFNTSSYIWEGSVVDLDQSVAMNLPLSSQYLTNSCAVYASLSIIGSQDILLLGSTRVESTNSRNSMGSS